MANATNKIGQTQTASLLFNPAGYHNNVMQSITLVAVEGGDHADIRYRCA